MNLYYRNSRLCMMQNMQYTLCHWLGHRHLFPIHGDCNVYRYDTVNQRNQSTRFVHKLCKRLVHQQCNYQQTPLMGTMRHSLQHLVEDSTTKRCLLLNKVLAKLEVLKQSPHLLCTSSQPDNQQVNQPSKQCQQDRLFGYLLTKVQMLSQTLFQPLRLSVSLIQKDNTYQDHHMGLQQTLLDRSNRQDRFYMICGCRHPLCQLHKLCMNWNQQ